LVVVEEGRHDRLKVPQYLPLTVQEGWILLSHCLTGRFVEAMVGELTEERDQVK
jgi:hypothetical protein